MPNLLIFMRLVTLYLGRFVVRVVSEIECRMLKSVQENRVSRLDLAGDSRLQLPNAPHMPSMPEGEQSC